MSLSTQDTEQAIVPAETADSAIQSATDARIEQSIFYDPDNDFRNLALEAQFRSRGFRLVSKDDMVGVPHAIIGVTFREGFPRDGQMGDYVSIEAIVADKTSLDSAPVKSMLPADMTVWPNEPVVYNDSSTGIRRELVRVFHSIGMVDVGQSSNPDENTFDRQFQLWADGADKAQMGFTKNDFGGKAIYLALRGLRRSDYESPYGPATTFYFG